MRPNAPSLSAMRLNNPQAFAAFIRDSLESHGSRRKLAAWLGVSVSTAIRWVRESQMDLVSYLSSVGACQDAIEWAGAQPDVKTAWESCERGDWLLWVAAKAGVDRKLVVLAACACARLALVHVPAGELRPLRCIEVTEPWCRGEATIKQVREAPDADAAYAAAADAADAAAAAASAAAAVAADAAAYAAAYAAASAAYAAASAAYASYAAYAAADARKETLRKCAEIVRERIPMPMVA